MNGSLPITLEDIVHFKGNGPLIAGDNYYQAIGTNTDNYSMLIKKGADYRKGVRTLSNILDQASDKRTDDSRRRFIVDEFGEPQKMLLLDVSEGNLSFLISSLQENYKKALKIIEGDAVFHSMSPDGKKYWEVAKQIVLKVLAEKTIVYYMYTIQNQDQVLFRRQIQLSFYALFLGVALQLEEKDLLTIGRAAILSEAGAEDAMDDSRLDPVSLVPTKVNRNQDFLRGMGVDGAIVKVLEHLHSSLVDKKDRLLSQIVQVAQVLYGYSYRFWVRVGDKADIPEAKLSPENALSRLVVESNPKVNDQCPNPMFDEKVVSRLVISLGFEFLLARERMIRNEILKNCTFTRCLKNRVSVVCCHKNFERSVQEGLQYCEGQAEITNVFEEGSRTGGVYYNKCKSGCIDLSKINERVKQMRARQAAS